MEHNHDQKMIDRITDGIAASATTAVSNALRHRVPAVVWRDGKITEVSLSELEAIQRQNNNAESK